MVQKPHNENLTSSLSVTYIFGGSVGHQMIPSNYKNHIQHTDPPKLTQTQVILLYIFTNHCCIHHSVGKRKTTLPKTKSNNRNINPSRMVLALPLKGFMRRGSGRVKADPTHSGKWPLIVCERAYCCIVGYSVSQSMNSNPIYLI